MSGNHYSVDGVDAPTPQPRETRSCVDCGGVQVKIDDGMPTLIWACTDGDCGRQDVVEQAGVAAGDGETVEQAGQRLVDKGLVDTVQTEREARTVAMVCRRVSGDENTLPSLDDDVLNRVAGRLERGFDL